MIASIVSIDRQDLINKKFLPYLTFLIWPLFGLIYAIVNWRLPWSKNIVWLFCGFFGFTFYIPPDGPDANRYRDYLIDFHYSGTDLWQYIPEVLQGRHGKGDMLEPMLRGVIGHFTEDHRILFCVFGLIMGYFLSRNVWFLLEKVKGKIPIVAFPFLWMVAFGIGIWQINGFRFWTAAHIFIYGLIVLFYQKERIKGTLFILLSVATHITFAIPVVLVILAVFLSGFPLLLMLVLALSIIFSSTPIERIVTIIPQQIFPSADLYIKGYLMSDVAQNYEKIKASQIWFLKLNDISARYLFSFLGLFYLVFHRRFDFLTVGAKNLMTVGILMLASYNVFYLFPSIGRFAQISFVIISMIYALFMIQAGERKTKWILTSIAILPLALMIAIQWRIGLYFLGPSSLFTSPLFAWVLDALPAFK